MRNRGQGSDYLPTLLRQNHRNLDGGPSSCGQAVYLHAEEKEMGSDCLLDMGCPFGVMKISWN